MSWWDSSRVVEGRVAAPPSAAIRPRLCGAPTLTTTVSMVAVHRPAVYEPLTCSVGSIANDCRRGSYLDFILHDFRKFAGRDSGSISPVLRVRAPEGYVLCRLPTEDLDWNIPQLLSTCLSVKIYIPRCTSAHTQLTLR